MRPNPEKKGSIGKKALLNGYNLFPRRNFLKLAGAGTLGAFALATRDALAGNLHTKPLATLGVEEAKKIALDAYIYGYSLITSEVTRVQMSNVPAVEQLRGRLVFPYLEVLFSRRLLSLRLVY